MWKNIRVKIFILIALSCLVVYLILRFFVFDSDPLVLFNPSISDSYLLLTEKLSNIFLSWVGDEVRFKNHILLLNDLQKDEFVPHLMFIKIDAFVLFLMWLTNTSISKKILYTIALIFVSFMLGAVYLAVGAHLTTLENYNDSYLAIPYILGNVCIITILFIWYNVNKESILNSLSKIKIDRVFLIRIIPSLFVLGYIYFILVQFLLNYFDFYYWMNILLVSAQRILSLLGEKATVEPYYLVGDNGSIYISQGCIGLKTIFLFASIIYLTKKKNISCWIYIIAGILFLNFVNVLRFVFLFIQIQEQGGNLRIEDIHNIYNIIVYAIIFVLWVIWFEKFADIRLRKRPTKSED